MLLMMTLDANIPSAVTNLAEKEDQKGQEKIFIKY